MNEQISSSEAPSVESLVTPPSAEDSHVEIPASPSAKKWIRLENVWVFYVIFLCVCGFAFLVSRSSVFSLLMFLATATYLGFQISLQYRQFRATNVSVTPSQRENSRQLVIMGTTAVAIVFMIFSAFEFRPNPNGINNLGLATVLMLIGGASLTIGQFFYNVGVSPASQAFVFAETTQPFPKSNSFATTAGILLLLVEAEISGNSLKITWLQGVSYWIQALLFWGGVLFVAIGMAGTTGLPWLRQTIQRIRKLDFGLLAIMGVIVLALILRVWDLTGSLPLSIDDGINIPTIWPLLGDHPAIGLIITSDGHYTTQLYSQFVALTVDLFGYNFTGARLADSLAGTLGVLAVFLLADALFDRKIALISALVLATFPPHLQFSRLMLAQIVDGTVGTFAIAFIARALKDNRRSDWALAGIALGLTQYFFEAGRLFFPPLVAFWLVWMAIFNFKTLKRFLPGLGVFIVTALVVAMPTYYAAFAQNVPFTSRYNVSGVTLDFWVNLWKSGDANAFWGRLIAPFLTYVHQPELGLYYGGSHPLVLEYLVPFFLLGLFYLLWRWRKPEIIVVALVVATAMANLLMRDPNGYPRYTVGLPAVGLAIAIGIGYVVPMLLVPLKRHIVTGILVLLVSVICVGQTLFYFDDNLPALRLEIRNSQGYPDGVDAALRSATLPGKTHVYLFSTYPVDVNPPRAVLSLYMWNRPFDLTLDSVTPDQVNSDFLLSLPRDKNYAFFVEPGHPDVVDRLSQYFVLDAPQYSAAPDMPPGKGFILYYAALGKQSPLPSPSAANP